MCPSVHGRERKDSFFFFSLRGKLTVDGISFTESHRVATQSPSMASTERVDVVRRVLIMQGLVGKKKKKKTTTMAYIWCVELEESSRSHRREQFRLNLTHQQVDWMLRKSRWMNGRMHWLMDGWINRQMNGWILGWLDNWMIDGCTDG